MGEKISEGLYKLKTYWRKPPKGYEVTYKEFVNYALGFGGLSFLSILIQWTGIATTTYMMISYFKISTGVVFFLNTVIGSILGLIRAPILSMLIDNYNDKKHRGKFKPFLIWSAIGTALSFGLIPFIPEAWTTIELFSITIPKIPIMGIYEDSVSTFSVAVIAMFVMGQIGAFFNTVLNQAMAGIEQTITSVAQERANFISIKGLISNIPASVINILLPIFAGILFADSGHQLNINLYRIFFPVCMVGGVICVLFAYYGTEERVVVNQKFVHKVRFIEGAKELSMNKYFWIITIFNIAAGVRGFANITGWICQFSFHTSTAKTLANLYCTTLLMNVLVLGMLTAPFLIKKIGKRKLMAISNIGFTVMVAFQYFVYTNPYLVLFATLLQNIFTGYMFVSGIMVSDALDYQQWKTGKRLEGFWQNYSGFIGTIAGIFTGMLLPLFLSFGGIGFGDDMNEVLRNTVLRDNAYKYQTLLALIGSVVAAVPMLFYDLTEDKHANIVRSLKLRAAADNYRDNMLLDSDVLNTAEILKYAEETNDEFILDEISKHDCLAEIVKNSEEVAARVHAEEQNEEMQNFARDLELEFKRVNAKLEKAEKKSKADFNKDEVRKEIMLKTRYLKLFVDGELSKYTTMQSVNDNLDEVYSAVCALRK